MPNGEETLACRSITTVLQLNRSRFAGNQIFDLIAASAVCHAVEPIYIQPIAIGGFDGEGDGFLIIQYANGGKPFMEIDAGKPRYTQNTAPIAFVFHEPHAIVIQLNPNAARGCCPVVIAATKCHIGTAGVRAFRVADVLNIRRKGMTTGSNHGAIQAGMPLVDGIRGIEIFLITSEITGKDFPAGRHGFGVSVEGKAFVFIHHLGAVFIDRNRQAIPHTIET